MERIKTLTIEDLLGAMWILNNQQAIEDLNKLGLNDFIPTIATLIASYSDDNPVKILYIAKTLYEFLISIHKN